jgi:GLPGLI family protein
MLYFSELFADLWKVELKYKTMNRSVILRLAFILQFVFLLPLAMLSQTDKAIMRIQYEAKFRNAKEKALSYDEQILLIGNQYSIYYSALAESRQQVLDSVRMASGGDLSQILAASQRFRTTSFLGQKYVVMKHWPTEDALTYKTTIQGNGFKYSEPMPAFNWQLVEGDTVIAEHTCYKAVAEYRGQTWNAWYTPDITVNDGPWKLCGLPGLILCADTADDNFSFSCTAILQGKSEEMIVDSKGCKTIAPINLQKLLTLEATDPGALATRLIGHNLQQMEMRRHGKKKRMTPVLIEDYNSQK